MQLRRSARLATLTGLTAVGLSLAAATPAFAATPTYDIKDPVPAHDVAVCYYKGQSYSDGAVIEMVDGRYKCVNGQWKYEGPLQPKVVLR